MNAHVYRLKQINSFEQELNEEKIKQIRTIQKYHSVINFCDACLFIVQFCVLWLNFGFLSNFQEVINKISGMILHGLVLWFGTLTVFLKIIEKQFLKKVRKHDKQITLVEKQENAIKNLLQKRCLIMKFQNLSLKRFFLR